MGGDRVLCDAQTVSNLRVAQALELMEDKHFAATRRQIRERGVKRLKLLPRDQRRIGQRRWIDDRFVKFDGVAERAPLPLSRTIDRQVSCGTKEIASEVAYVFAWGAEQPQECILNDVGSGGRGYTLPYQKALEPSLLVGIKRRQIARQVAHQAQTNDNCSWSLPLLMGSETGLYDLI
ncbi:hypothetical protein J2S34_003659 [Nitrobacter winogradskyi]|uniref:Uncharacterized protein n=2 Tax=Nitrobacter winogradskyi TaxID=913 RepID=A0ACC6AN21_NITWI|nr:hypothetical protein [Nitrobacter winogradskyi]GEC17473.1 hypothetical protein NWI01_33650 [Nitrobacter winogradskyi]